MKTKKPNYMKIAKAMMKENKRLIYCPAEWSGTVHISDGHCVITIPEYEFNYIKESFDHDISFQLADCLVKLFKDNANNSNLHDIKMTTLSINFQDTKTACIFKSKDGKFLSCVNKMFVDMVKESIYSDGLNFAKAESQKSPIIYNDGTGCGFALLPINMDASEILSNVLNFDY